MFLRAIGSLGPVAFSRLVSMACALVQLPILTRSLEPLDYAIVVAAISTATYFSLVVGDPTTLSFQRFPGTINQRENFNYASRRLGIAIGIGAAVLTLASIITGEYERFLGVLGWGAGLASMRFISTAWLMWKKPWKYALNLAMSTVLRTTTLVILVLIGASPLISLAAAGAVSLAVAILLGAKPKWRGLAIPPVAPWPRGMGVSLVFGSLGMTVLQTYDTIIVPSLVAEAQAAQYAAMHQAATLTITAALGVITTTFAPIALTHWSEGRRARTLELTNVVILASSTIAIVACTTVMLGGDQVVGAIIGHEYVDRTLCITMICIGALQAIGLQLSWIHRFTLKVARVRNVSLVCAILAVSLTPLAALSAGAQGVAMSMLGIHMLYVLGMVRETGIARSVTVVTLLILSAALVQQTHVPLAQWIVVTAALTITSCMTYIQRQALTRERG